MFTPNPTRRDLLKLTAAGVLTTSFSGWLNVLAARAAQSGRTPTKHCILLWMDGGPSHKDTFDLRPGTANGGPYQAIQTTVPRHPDQRALSRSSPSRCGTRRSSAA